ncbi:hypothetical protein OG427_07205 [Streptomyces sp. NBC_00133]|uniref:hypothetical protein n=1 Tax=Streptomyces sp. NBC_00133 TaxID=2903624 RepID=UPI00324F0A2C
MRPAIETWLADGDTLVCQARAAAPGARTALTAHDQGLAAIPPALPAAPSQVPTRR